MLTTRQTKAATIQRTITISQEREPWGVTVYASVFEQHHGKRTVKNISDVYVLVRHASDFGVYITAEKVVGESDGEIYDVCLNQPGGGHSCTCKWGAYGSHKKNCRHVEAALQAVREQKL